MTTTSVKVPPRSDGVVLEMDRNWHPTFTPSLPIDTLISPLAVGLSEPILRSGAILLLVCEWLGFLESLTSYSRARTLQCCMATSYACVLYGANMKIVLYQGKATMDAGHGLRNPRRMRSPASESPRWNLTPGTPSEVMPEATQCSYYPPKPPPRSRPVCYHTAR